jgi:hypothetical protein
LGAAATRKKWALILETGRKPVSCLSSSRNYHGT